MSDTNYEPDYPERQPELDNIFELLTDQCRRLVLHCLVEEQTAELDELVDAVCASVESDPPEVTMTLHHTRLPKLERVGIIEYDSRSGKVRYYDHNTLERILDLVAQEDLSY